jgi:hypothetical protein
MDNTNNSAASPAPAVKPIANPAPPAPAVSQPNGGINQAPAGKKSNGVIIIAIAVGIIVCLAVVLLILAPWKKSGGSGNGDDKGGSSSSEAAYNTKGKCKFYECLHGLTVNRTLDDINNVIGFEPEVKVDEERHSETYTWVFDDNHTIVMNASTWSGTSTTTSVRLGEYIKEEIEQDGVTFANVAEIKANMNKDDGVSYDEFKEYMGGVDGVLVEVGSWNKYEWRSTSAEGYMTGSFGTGNKCMFMSGATY